MPKQQRFSARLGQSGLNFPGGLFQQRTNNLWTKEGTYLQKLTEGSRYFNNSGRMMTLSAQPLGHFWGFLQGLEKKLAKPDALSTTAAAINGSQDDAIAATPRLTMRKNSEPLTGEKNSAGYPSHGAIYGLGENQQPERTLNKEMGPMETIENNTVYQSYLTQQINQYLYQTQRYKEETHLHLTEINRDGTAEIRPKSESAAPSYATVDKKSLVLDGGPTPVFSTKSGNEAAEQWLSVGGAPKELTKNADGQWETMPSFVSNQDISFSASSCNPISSLDWSGLLSMVQQNMAESFTELLQNMIPETGGR